MTGNSDLKMQNLKSIKSLGARQFARKKSKEF